MDVPVPQPRRKSTTKLLNSDSTDVEERECGSPFFQSKTIQVVHTVDVHNSLGDTSTNVEDNSSKTSERKKKKLKRKGTYSVPKSQSQKSQDKIENVDHLDIQSLNGSPKKCDSGTETISDSSSSSASNKIKLIPLMGKERTKKASGYATETLSDESESESKKTIPIIATVQKEDENINDQKNLESLKNSESEHENKGDIESFKNSDNESIPLIALDDLGKVEGASDRKSVESSSPLPPVPLPRRSGSRSLENLLDGNQSSVHGSPQSYCTSSSRDYKDTPTLPNQRFRKQRRKKKLKEQNTEDIKTDDEKLKSIKSSGKDSQETDTKSKITSQKSDNFICLTIHNCEPLNVKDFKTRPFVKVTFMDIDGRLKTNDKGEAVEPLVTQSYDFLIQRSMIPTWNEDMIVMEPLESVLNTNTILIIEIIDEEKGKGIAWGFLKPVAANGVSNDGKKLRLQLFKQGKPTKDSAVPQAFIWWKKHEQKKYKSTLFLTLAGIPQNMIVNNKVDVQKKTEIAEKSPNKSIENFTENEDGDLENVKWGRLPSLSCKLPNKYLARLPAGPDGSIAVAYSHSGLLLASANKGNIGVYTFRGRPYLSLQGHTGLVYSVKWSPNDKYLLSASADFSSCVWDISKKISTPIQILSHPSYVYSCCWLDNTNFATGCFDSDIRIWKIGLKSAHQHASRHSGQVNSLLSYDNHLVSGDSTGAVYIWQWDNDGNIEFERELPIREIKGKVINKISLHPGKKRLLVHTRDSVLRMVDMATGSILHWFQGLVNTRLREDSTFCGCGSLVLAWSEDSTLCVWDGNTGAQAGLYPGLAPDFSPGAVDFHPRDHMMAVSGHSPLAPTLSILTYDRKSNGREVSLVLLNGKTNPYLANPDLKIPYSDRSAESTPRKKESLLKTLLGSRRKSKKSTTSTPPSIENSFTDFSRFQGASRQREIEDPVQKESRLNDIIKRMDIILTSVSQNNRSLYSS